MMELDLANKYDMKIRILVILPTTRDCYSAKKEYHCYDSKIYGNSVYFYDRAESYCPNCNHKTTEITESIKGYIDWMTMKEAYLARGRRYDAILVDPFVVEKLGEDAELFDNFKKMVGPVFSGQESLRIITTRDGSLCQ